MKYIDCKKYADEIIAEVAKIPNKTKGLLVLAAGDDPASAAYMRGKEQDCKRCGIPFLMRKVKNQRELVATINAGNMIDDIGGIIVQLPLPEGFDADEAINEIKPEKDVDGFITDSPFKPCTPEGIIYILEKQYESLEGKTVLLIGKGKLVGRPLIDMLLDKGCTLTVAHSRTRNLDYLLECFHDIIISAVGKPWLFDMGCTYAGIIIDAGISRDDDGKLRGDCYGYEDNEESAPKVTPVPGGVGLMTRAMLMKHMGEVNGGVE